MSPPIRATADRALGSLGLLALAAGVVVLVLVALASVLLAVRNADALALATQTERARAAIADVLTSVQDAETGQRGFLLTGRESYLEPYTATLRHLPEQIERLNASLPAAASGRRLVVDMETALDRKMNELRRTVDLAQIGETDEAVAIVRSDLGLQLMATIRGLADQIADEENAIYERQIATVNQRGRVLVVADIAGLLLVLLLASAVGLGLGRSLRALRAARAELRATNGLLAGANTKLEQANAELEARVLARTADLTEANDEIQRFAYIVSHDLRSPLVNIMGFTGELEDATRRLSGFVAAAMARAPEAVAPDVREAADVDLPEAIRFIKTSTSKMDRLIAAILRLSREGQRVLTPVRVEMRPLLQAIVDSLHQQAIAKDARVTVGELPDVAADRLVLEQIFSNLLENALKYLVPGRPGRVQVLGRTAKGHVEIDVADNGRGIAEHDRERVFELFRRAGTQDVPGEGIGLAHVRALVRRLGGKIDCESLMDVGSTFRVSFPLAPAASDRAEMSPGEVRTGS